MNIKQSIVLGKHLGMRKGKMVAQGSHASMGAFTKDGKIIQHEGKQMFAFEVNDVEAHWLTNAFKKICLGAKSEAELQEVYDQAIASGLRAIKIIDSGLTEFDGVPTFTAVAIGPDLAEKIDPITKDLGLL